MIASCLQSSGPVATRAYRPRPLDRLATPAVLTLLAFAAPAAAQCFDALAPQIAPVATSTPSITSSSPLDSRIELINAPPGFGIALRVDKYLGRVWILSREGDGSPLLTPIMPAEIGGTLPSRVNYQLFVAEGANQPIFLMNVFTGLTWQLMADGPNRAYLWRVVRESNDRARAYR